MEERHTNVEETLRSKSLYRLFQGFLKVIPIILAGLYLLNTVLSYFELDYSVISYMAGIGIIPWLFLLLASYVLRFCEWHRMFLWYIAAHNIICWADYTFGLPVTDWGYVMVHFIVAGIFLFLILYFRLKCK